MVELAKVRHPYEVKVVNPLLIDFRGHSDTRMELALADGGWLSLILQADKASDWSLKSGCRTFSRQ